jgi:hypothetical protein
VQQAKKIKILLFAFLFIFAACHNTGNNSTKSNVLDFKWIVGEWINNEDTAALFFENWTKNNAGDFSGKSYVLANRDTVFFVSIMLRNLDSGTYYENAVRYYH